MQKPARLLLPLILLSGVAACHTDPFSVKPEVRGVTIPDRSGAGEERPGEDQAEPVEDQKT